jgi:GT2 family glycosyltransferase
MGLLARLGVLALMIMLSILVIASILIGHLRNGNSFVAIEEVDGQSYLIYVTDTAYNIRVQLAGNGCFQEPPPVIPHANWDSETPTQLQYRRFFLKRISWLFDVRCYRTDSP